MQARTIATIIGGIATQLLAVAVWYAGWRLFQGDLLKMWVNLILPFGAFVLGAIGGCGVLIVGRLAKQPATPGLLWTATGIAVLAAFGIRFLGYWSLELGGVPLHQTMGFGPYLQMTLGHARIDLDHGGQSLGSIQLGAFGYLMELLQTAAYAAVGFGYAAALPRAVRCDRGHGPMREKLWGKVRINDPRRFETWYLDLPADPAARLALLEVATSERGKARPGAIEIRFRRSECADCSQAALAESGVVHTGKYWAPFKEMARVTRFDRMRSPPQPARPAGPAVRSFGRRSI